jgi:anti-sigma regulatory factor (Ser/Thr protein kinase)
VVIEVSDDGPGAVDLASRGHELPVNELDSGRGLFLVRAVASDVSTVSTGEGSSIRCVVPLPVREPAPTEG